MRTLLSLSLIVLATFGCSKSDTSNASAVSSTSAAVMPAPGDPVLAKINATVPKEMASLLQFEAVSFRGDANGDGDTDLDERVNAYKPKGWLSHEDFNGSAGTFYEATDAKPDASIFDRLGKSQLDIENECDGLCEPKDWKKLADTRIKDAFGEKAETKDETLPHDGRIRWGTWTENFGGTKRHGAVYAAWITPGARVMRTCKVSIDDESLLPALDAFAEACKVSQKF